MSELASIPAAQGKLRVGKCTCCKASENEVLAAARESLLQYGGNCKDMHTLSSVKTWIGHAYLYMRYNRSVLMLPLHKAKQHSEQLAS